jgi:hypothetical protein
MKRVLRIILASELESSDGVDDQGYYVFYEDNTYIWVGEYDIEAECDPSEWKIENGSMWVKHPMTYTGKQDWICCRGEPDDEEMVRILEGELAVKKILEEDLPTLG